MKRWLVLLLLIPTSVPAATRPIRIHYEGTLEYEAHYRKPGETRAYHSDARWAWDGKDRCRLDITVSGQGDTTAQPETFLLLGERLFHRPDPGSRWVLTGGAHRTLDLLQAEAGIPGLLLRDAATRLGPGQPSLTIRHGRLEQLVILRAHPRLGDIRDSVATTFDRNGVPSEMTFVLHERDAQWRMRQHRVDWREGSLPDSLFQPPASFDPAKPSDEDSKPQGEPAIVEVAPHVFSFDMEDIDSRSLVVEFADHLAMIEFAVGSANGERMADAARKRWPGKPIRYALFSHYHPHYAGGLRAMIAEGATIVSPAGNEAFVRSLPALPFHVEPDRLARSPRPVSVRTFTDSLTLTDSLNSLVAYNYGARSNHTDDFVVFYLPKARLLFETELGWVTSDGKLRAIRRAPTLLSWIGEKHLDVDRFVQCWPMRGNAASLTRAELVALANPPTK